MHSNRVSKMHFSIYLSIDFAVIVLLYVLLICIVDILSIELHYKKNNHYYFLRIMGFNGNKKYFMNRIKKEMKQNETRNNFK